MLANSLFLTSLSNLARASFFQLHYKQRDDLFLETLGKRLCCDVLTVSLAGLTPLASRREGGRRRAGGGGGGGVGGSPRVRIRPRLNR